MSRSKVAVVTLGSSSQQNVTIQVDQCPPNIINGYLNVHCSVTNNCGTGDIYTEWTTIDCSSGGGEHLKAFPNPSNNEIIVDTRISGKTITEVKIIDKFGNIRLQIRFPGYNKMVKIDVSRLPSDIYYLHVFAGQVWATKLILVAQQ